MSDQSLLEMKLSTFIVGIRLSSFFLFSVSLFFLFPFFHFSVFLFGIIPERDVLHIGDGFLIK
jgi:hypothetical protein